MPLCRDCVRVHLFRYLLQITSEQSGAPTSNKHTAAVARFVSECTRNLQRENHRYFSEESINTIFIVPFMKY